MNSAYITSMGAYLPGEPVDNDAIEARLGLIGGQPSRLKARILQSNGIQTRHYALDGAQQTTVQNEEMAASAIRQCLARSPWEPKAIPLLAVASAQGDLVLPGFASMVQAAAGIPAAEILTTHGICCCGMMALKAAANSLALGQHPRAVVCASEHVSRNLKASRYEAAGFGNGRKPEFDAEFLRWMLSDGAGAMLLESMPAERGLSLRIEWIHLVSQAQAYPVCMSAGRAPDQNGSGSWQDYATASEAEAAGALLIRQDMDLLDHMLQVGVEGYLRLIDAGRLNVADIDHFCCHYSSHYFRGRIVELLERAGAMIPESRWFTNLYTRGNTGCAAPFLMLEELFMSGRLQAGETVFCFVPESGRFAAAYLLMTVIEGSDA